MGWRSWCPEGVGDEHPRRGAAINEVVAFLAADMFEIDDVRVEWWMGGRWVLAPRATFEARARGRAARQRQQGAHGTVIRFPARGDDAAEQLGQDGG